MTVVNIKRGDTLSLAGTYKVDGVAASVSAMTIESHVKNHSGDLIEELTVTKTSGTGTFTISATAVQTAEWPLTTLKCDIQFSASGVVQSTETFSISVEEDITV